MKTHLFFSGILLSVFAVSGNAQGTWTRKADFGGSERFWAVGFSIGDKGYIGTGLSGNNVYYKDFWEFDPMTNAWSQKADFGGSARDRAIGFGIGNKGYVGTGSSSSNGYLKDFWEYDTSTNSWTRKADFGGPGRYSAFSFVIGTKGYVGTGDIASFTHSKDFWEYDQATDKWTRKADFGGVARQYAAAFAINGRGYAGTGYIGSRLSDFWEYNPSTDTWSQKADFGGGGRNGAIAFAINGKGYMGTGENPSYNTFKDFWEYDPATDKWTKRADVDDMSRAYAIGFSIGNKGYAGTGRNQSSTYLKDFWEYAPESTTGGISAITDINTSQAVVHWFPITNATNYILRFYAAGTTDYFYAGYSTPITDTFKKIYNLLPSTTYNVQVKAFLSGSSGSTAWSAPASFTTLDNCIPPTTLNVTNITSDGAQLNWSNSGMTRYNFRIRYRMLGTTTWTELWLKATATSTVLSGLLPNTTYNWQIKRKCSNDASEWVNGYYFTTASSVLSNGITSNIKGIRSPGVRIVPNPNNGNFILQMQLPKAAASTMLTLYNNTGEIVWQQDAGKISGAVYKNIALNNKLSTGTYILIVQRNDARLEQKIVINK